MFCTWSLLLLLRSAEFVDAALSRRCSLLDNLVSMGRSLKDGTYLIPALIRKKMVPNLSFIITSKTAHINCQQHQSQQSAKRK